MVQLSKFGRKYDQNNVLLDVKTGKLYKSCGIAARAYKVSAAYVAQVATGESKSKRIDFKWVELSDCKVRNG